MAIAQANINNLIFLSKVIARSIFLTCHWNNTETTPRPKHYTPYTDGINNPLIISAGDWHTLAIKDGELWAWGFNNYGQLGDGNTGTAYNKSTPGKVSEEKNWVAIAAGSNHSLAIDMEGRLWSWGRNNYGQLGLGTDDTANRSTPEQVGSASYTVSNVIGDILATDFTVDVSLT